MGKKRDLIKMSHDEIRLFITRQKSIQVATLGINGWPHLTTLWFALDNDEIVLETFSKSQKVKNLQRDNRISVLFEEGDIYEQLKAVSIEGYAELITEVEEVHRLHMKVILRNNSAGYPTELLEEASKAMAPKKTAIRIKPIKIMSWDHSKLAGVY